MLKKWRNQQKQWDRLKKKIANKVGKNEKDLVITRGEEYRESVEEVDLLSKSLPMRTQASSQWQHSLRDTKEASLLVPIGNIFSGLYCKVVSKDTKPIKESVKKPRPAPQLMYNGLGASLTLEHPTFPGKGAASKHWKSRTSAFELRRKMHKRMQNLKTTNIDELEGLEICGISMFDVLNENIEFPSYSYEKNLENATIELEQSHQTKTLSSCQASKTENESNLSDSFNKLQNQSETMDEFSANISFEPSPNVILHAKLNQSVTKVLTLKNCGSTAAIIQFRDENSEVC